MDRPGPFSDSRRQSQQNFNKSGNFLKFFFRGSISERNVQSYISNEGSIHQNVWNGMNKNANWKVRLKTVENLEELARKRRLQVSVLEGIWAETNDMLHQESLRKAFLSLMCSLTKAQNEELGLALRSTFFEAIQTIGLEEASLRWLLALTDEGKILEPFEYKLGDLLTEWLEVVFKFEHHPLASEVILLTERVVVRNSTFLDEKTLKYIVHNSCKRISQNSTSLVLSLLSCLEAILKYSHVPKSELFPLVTCVCLLISNSSHSSSSWKLMRILLTSVNAYSVLRMLQSLLTNFFHLHSADIPKNSLIMIVRGAVFCVAMSLWGSQRIESLRCSPSIIIPSLAEAMVLDPLIANEVVRALRRVIGKYGKSLQQPTWSCILQTLEKAIKYAKTNVNSNELYIELVSIISSIENMQLDNKFCGSVEAFFNLLEQSSDFLPDESVLRLIEYKAQCIDPCCGDWINQMLALIQKYIHQSNSAKRREKALYILRSTYYKYKLLYETDVIRGLVLKICTMIPNESNSNFQYEMITFVFDVARSVSLRVNSRNDVFMEIISLIRESFNCRKMKSETVFVDHGVDNDNLEIIACHIEELLNERWTALDPSLIQAIFDLLMEHLKTLYSSKMQDLSVPEVRARIFETLLRVHSHPLNQQLVKSMVLPNMSQKVLLLNSRIIVGEEGFKWSSVCEITIRAMQTELCWRVIKKVLECLVNVLEFRSFVYSAGQHLVNQLSEALLDLNTRFENGQFVGLERSELSKYLCPVLGRLINYYQQARLCKILVDFTRLGCVQAIMACDLAVQVLPKKMTLYNRQLMENLTRIRPNAQVAIPLLELIGDSADVSEFFQFFQEKHFRSVVDVLAPYSSCRHFNLFIIASVHRVILRWFSKVQEDMRNAMSQYILQTFTAANEKPELSLMPSQSTKSGALVQTCSSHKGQDRSSKDLSGATEVNSTLAKDYKSSSASLNLSESSNLLGNAATPVPISHSGEEIVQVVQPFVISHSDVLANQLRLDDEINFMCSGQWDDLTPKSTSFSIGPSNTPEISPSIEMHHQQWMSAEHVRRLNNWDVTEDAFESMQLFMRYWKKKMHSCQSSPDSPNSYKNFFVNEKEEIVEKRVENWIMDGNTVLTMRVLARRKPDDIVLLGRRNASTFSIERPSTSGLLRAAKTRVVANAVASSSIDSDAANSDKSLPSHKDSLDGACIQVATTSKSKPFTPAVMRSDSSESSRRRHQSSTHVGPQHRKSYMQLLNGSTNNAFDSFTDKGSLNTEENSTTTPKSEWVQLIIRHVYGKDSWVMRPFENIPMDFGQSVNCSSFTDPSSLLGYLCGKDAFRIPPKENENVQRTLRLLDKVEPEELHAVGVLYLGEDQSSEAEILANQYGSERYVKFMRLLGEVASLADDPGGLQMGKHGKFTYEYKDAISKIVFLVATLMPNSEDDPKCNAKKSLISNNFVSIIFNESGKPYKQGTVSGNFDKVALEVVPHDEETILVSLHARKEIAAWLALTKAFLPDAVAVKALRKMAIRAQLAVNVWRSLEECLRNEKLRPYLSQAVDRLRRIQALKLKRVPEM